LVRLADACDIEPDSWGRDATRDRVLLRAWTMYHEAQLPVRRNPFLADFSAAQRALGVPLDSCKYEPSTTASHTRCLMSTCRLRFRALLKTGQRNGKRTLAPDVRAFVAAMPTVNRVTMPRDAVLRCA
jgi:hypothetical protein